MGRPAVQTIRLIAATWRDRQVKPTSGLIDELVNYTNRASFSTD